MSTFTLLIPNDVLGLQVWCQDHWITVDFLQNTLLVHVGDQLEVLSNGKYQSVQHRSLVNKERTRMSWAVFMAPPHEAVIRPLPVLVNQENPPKFSTKTFSEYRHCKFNKLPQ